MVERGEWVATQEEDELSSGEPDDLEKVVDNEIAELKAKLETATKKKRIKRKKRKAKSTTERILNATSTFKSLESGSGSSAPFACS